MHVVTPHGGLSSDDDLKHMQPLWLSVWRAGHPEDCCALGAEGTTAWGGGGQRGDTSSWGDPQVGVRMRTKGGETETVSGTCVCRTFQCCGSEGATEERAAAEAGTRVLPLPRARGPVPPAGEGRRALGSGPGSWPRPARATTSSGVRPRPFPLCSHSGAQPPGHLQGPGKPWSLPSPVPLPRCPLSAYSCSQPGPGQCGYHAAPSRFPYPHPPRPCRHWLPPRSRVLRPRLSRRGAAAGAPLP